MPQLIHSSFIRLLPGFNYLRPPEITRMPMAICRWILYANCGHFNYRSVLREPDNTPTGISLVCVCVCTPYLLINSTLSPSEVLNLHQQFIYCRVAQVKSVRIEAFAFQNLAKIVESHSDPLIIYNSAIFYCPHTNLSELASWNFDRFYSGIVTLHTII